MHLCYMISWTATIFVSHSFYHNIVNCQLEDDECGHMIRFDSESDALY